MLSQRLLISAVLLSACAIPAMADITSYSSLSNLEAAVPADTFSNISFAQGNLGTNVDEMGVVFSASPSDLEGTTGSALGGSPFYQTWPSGSAVYVVTIGDTMTITLPTAVNAVSFYVGSTDQSAKVSVSDNGGGSPDTFTATPGTSPMLINLGTDSSFTTFTIQEEGSGQVGIDDMQVGQTAEVATFLLVGTGLLLIGYFGRRRLSQPAAA